MTLDQARAGIGRTVIYSGPRHNEPERGVITRISDSFVMVRFGNELASTRMSPGDLAFAE